MKGENPFHPTLGTDLTAISSSSDAPKIAAIQASVVRSRRVQGSVDVQRLNDPNRARRYDFDVKARLRSGGAISLTVGGL